MYIIILMIFFKKNFKINNYNIIINILNKIKIYKYIYKLYYNNIRKLNLYKI